MKVGVNVGKVVGIGGWGEPAYDETGASPAMGRRSAEWLGLASRVFLQEARRGLDSYATKTANGYLALP